MKQKLLYKVSAIVLTVFAGGCMVGPDFERPAFFDVSSYFADEVPSKTSDGFQNLAAGKEVPSNWWLLFDSPKLNELIVLALKNNQTLAASEASLRAAEAALYVGEAGLFPAITGGFSSGRSSTGNASPYNLFKASVGIAYNLDIWGGTRRNIERLQAQVDMAKYELEAAKLTIVSNVITLAISEASLREQIELLKANIDAQEKTLNLYKIQFDAGAISRVELVSQEGTLAGLKVSLPSLENNLSVTRNALTALVGQLPEKQIEQTFTLADMTLPKEIPLSVPSELVSQRPDIRAAEEALHAASADIGVAAAARLPNLTLTGGMGTSSGVLEKMFSSGTGLWSIGAEIAGVIFDAGALAQKEQIAREQFEVMVARYNQTIITSFHQVADTLYALEADAKAFVHQKESMNASKAYLDLSAIQFDAGAVSMIELLQAERGYYAARSLFVQSAATRLSDTVALFAALGGGFESKTEVPSDNWKALLSSKTNNISDKKQEELNAANEKDIKKKK